jgi:hypothetical protein
MAETERVVRTGGQMPERAFISIPLDIREVRVLRTEINAANELVVVAKYVMVGENLPHDRRNYQVLVSIMRQ